MEYLLENPTADDEYEGKAHSKVAQQLYDNLTSDNVYSIGLEGGLGSGKSSILKKVDKISREDDKASKSMHQLVFDTERYHNNNVNKALINEIYDGITDNCELMEDNQKALLDARNRALGNVVDYRRTVTSDISWWVVTLLISIFISIEMLPDGIESLSKSCFSLSNSCKFNWTYTLQVLTMLMPVIWWGIFILAKRFGFTDKKLLQIFSRQVPEDITEVLEVPSEIGSYELNTALDKFVLLIPDDHLVVIVIDNLDRVPKSVFPQVWADLEVFTHHLNTNFKIIVPYSRAHVAEALSDNSNDNNGLYQGLDFISKRLPVKLKVPSALQTDWKSVLAKLLVRAKAEYICEDTLRVMQKLIQLWLPKEAQITPRYLKRLVNELATVFNGYQHLDIKILFAYVNATQYGQCDIEYLLNFSMDSGDEYPHKDELSQTYNLLRDAELTEIEIKDGFAELHYQVDGQLAAAANLNNQFDGALTREDIGILFKYKEYGYDDVFGEFLSSDNVIAFTDIFIEFIQEGDAEIVEHWMNTYSGLYVKALSKRYVGEVPEPELLSKLCAIYEKLKALNLNADGIESYLLAYQDLDNHQLAREKNVLASLKAHHEIYRVTDVNISKDILSHSPSGYFHSAWQYEGEFPLWSEQFHFKTVQQRQLIIDYINSESDLSPLSFQAVINRMINDFKITGNSEHDSGFGLLGVSRLTAGEYESPEIYGINFFTTEFFAGSSQINAAQINQLDDKLKGRAISYLIVNELRKENIPYLQQQLNAVSTSNTDYEVFLKQDLILVGDLAKIMHGFENTIIKPHVESSLIFLIKEGKINCAEVKSIFGVYFEQLLPLFNNVVELIEWVNQWAHHLVKNENGEYTKDIFSIQYLECLMGLGKSELAEPILTFFDNGQEKYDWLGALKEPSEKDRLENKLFSVNRTRANTKKIMSTLRDAVKNGTFNDMDPIFVSDILNTVKQQNSKQIYALINDMFWQASSESTFRHFILTNFNVYLISEHVPLDAEKQKILITQMRYEPSEGLRGLFEKFVDNINHWESDNISSLAGEIEAHQLTESYSKWYVKPEEEPELESD